MEGTAWTLHGECWPCRQRALLFGSSTSSCPLGTRFLLNLQNSRGVTIIFLAAGWRQAPGPVSQPFRPFLTLQTPEMAWEQTRLVRPHPKIFAELMEKAVHFWFILNLSCLMIQHVSGASGSHFVSGKSNMLKNEASAEGSGLKRWRRFLIRVFSAQCQTQLNPSSLALFSQVCQ